MKIAFRLIYNNAAVPSCDIIDMDSATWILFLSVAGEGTEAVCKFIGITEPVDLIQTVSWMPIDGLEEILETNPVKNVARIFDKSTLRMFLQPFLEMNTSLTCNQVSRIVNMVKEHHDFAKKKQPTVNDLTAMTVEEVMESKRMGKRTLQIIQETLSSYGLAFSNKQQ